MLLYVFTVLLLLNVLTQQASAEACVNKAPDVACDALYKHDQCLLDMDFAKEFCRKSCFLCGLDPSVLKQ
ncbi:hypothetical protein OESDEN_23210 [Oesophagostomum dentatum]|uniref:ShKT domain-containing protein n=1 Tax=Oesophagostomum dentatum TaxID=61180 RepID=A0A0B1S1W0_OESDE|nr:hypothetical protein OESDEN_23210 [Oesophagostomum dentatum]